MTRIGIRLLLTMTIIAAALAACVLVSPNPGMAQAGGEFISERVALVNGDILTERELLFTLLREYGSETIDDLVENEIIASHAEEIGVSLGPNEVAGYLADAYTAEKLDALTSAFGEDLLEDTVGTELLAFRTVAAKIDQVVTEHAIAISDEEIREFYLENLPVWTEPASVRFSLMELPTEEDALAARRRIMAGEDFADVCRDVSTHPGTRAYGGDIGGLVPEGYAGGERALLQETAFNLEIRGVSRPLEVEEKWYLVMPTEKTEYHEPTLEERRDTIHAILLDNQVEPYLEEWRAALWENAEIEVAYPVYLDVPASSFTPGAAGSFIAPTVAIVNGRDIPEGAVFFHLLRQYGSDVIEALIENVLLCQEAAAMGIDTASRDAREQLRAIYQDSGKLALLDAAFSPEALDRTVMRELTALEVLGARVQQVVEEQSIEITDEEVLDEYLRNLPRWTRPELVRFSMILVATETEARTARQRILGGESFEAVCREVSMDEGTRPYGGDIGDYIPRGYATGQNRIIEETAFSLPVGGVSEPFEVGMSWFLIKVTDKEDAYEPTLGEARDEIYAGLIRDRVAPFIYGWRRNIWEAADITVLYPIYADDASPEFTGGAPFVD